LDQVTFQSYLCSQRSDSSALKPVTVVANDTHPPTSIAFCAWKTEEYHSISFHQQIFFVVLDTIADHFNYGLSK